MSRRALRSRAILARWLPVVVIGLLVVTAFGGWLTYHTYVEPGIHTEQQLVSSWSARGSVEHSTTVSEPNPVFPVGTQLVDRDIYFRGIAPVLNGTLDLQYTATGGGKLSVVADIDLLIHAVGGSQVSPGQTPTGLTANRTEFWRVEEPITTRNVDGVAPGRQVVVPFSLNITEVTNRMAQITSELGGTPGEVEAAVEMTIQLNGVVNGQQVGQTLTTSMPIGIEGATYRPQAPDPIRKQYERTRTVVVENSYGPLRRVGAPVLLAVSLLGLVAVAIGWYRDGIELSPEERKRLDFYDDRSEFDEWTSTINLPDEVLDRPRAEAASFADLADIAIDTNNTVIEDLERREYYVTHDGCLYTYSPPSGVELSRSERTAIRLADEESDRIAPKPRYDEETSEPLLEDEGTDSTDSATNETGGPTAEEGAGVNDREASESDPEHSEE